MRTLVRKFLDSDISRRSFVREITALGVTTASAKALLTAVSEANAAERSDSSSKLREVTGNGSDFLFETLIEAGVENFFHGAGAGTNRFFDSIVYRPQLKNFLATNEGQCVAMAEGFHMASGRLGVVVIPKAGLGNAIGNIYNAQVNRSAILIITAREHGDYDGREGALEEVNWDDVVDPFMKWSYRMDNLKRVPEFTRRAVKVASTPPVGPTFLQMDEELYTQKDTLQILPQEKFRIAAGIRPDPSAIEKVAEMIVASSNPMVIVGGGVSRANAQEKMLQFAELLALPVAQGYSGTADFPNQHDLALGRYTPFIPLNRNTDLFLNIGGPMPERGNYTNMGPLPKQAKAIHISLEPNQLSAYQPTDVSILADAGAALEDLLEAVKSTATSGRLRSIREGRYEEIKDFTSGQRKKRMALVQRNWDKTPMTTARLSTEVDRALEGDAIITSEPVFGSQEWMDLGYMKKTMLAVAGPAILGWATGAAIGAKLAQPDKQVVALTGDGAFMFQHSLWSMSRYDAPITSVIYNNRAYNMTRAFTWRGNQAKAKMDMNNYLGDPDVNFTDIARAYGVDGEQVGDPADLKNAFLRATKANKDGRPYLLDVLTERWGPGGDLAWHPEISIASMRTRSL